MRISLITPPMTQLNTPYPATLNLAGFLRCAGYPDVFQADLSLALALQIFSSSGPSRVLAEIQDSPKKGSSAVSFFLKNKAAYLSTVDAVIRFLQGKDASLAYRICSRSLLPAGARFQGAMGDLDLAFGSIGIYDRAKFLASLYLDDLGDVIRDGVDPRFTLSRYAEKLASSEPTFDALNGALTADGSALDQMLEELTAETFEKHHPDAVCISVPFPGNVYGAFRIAKKLKQLAPSLPLVLGGGFVNTELRGLSDSRVFDYFDFICLDDGERPLQCILEFLQGKRPRTALLRTFVRESGQVVLISDPKEKDIPYAQSGTPSYEGVPLDSYFSILERLNPMHRLWSDTAWLKLGLAHGCYWKKCRFCDVSLDYIGRYEPAGVDRIVDRIVRLRKETGRSGFHFTDEAAPPALLKALAKKLIAQGEVISWWGNIRFEKTFTRELSVLLAQSGCIAVTGGLEVASDRLLKLMQKGVTVDQVARVARGFSEAGILVHAYLMYGFPTQTEQETVDSLERVRQLFAAGFLHSAYWHRFSATAHSPIGLEPRSFQIEILGERSHKHRFARNDLPFLDQTACDHDRLGTGLNLALYNYMQGVGLTEDVRGWFQGAGIQVPKPKVPRTWLRHLSPE